MRILFIGDIVGRPGRDLIRQGLAGLVDHHSIDLVIANAENAAAGFGITREIGDQLLEWGIDVMTSGNHIWDKKEALDYIGAERSEEHTSELQSQSNLVCRLLLEKKKTKKQIRK